LELLFERVTATHKKEGFLKSIARRIFNVPVLLIGIILGVSVWRMRRAR
jgi:hypothetical protein